MREVRELEKEGVRKYLEIKADESLDDIKKSIKEFIDFLIKENNKYHEAYTNQLKNRIDFLERMSAFPRKKKVFKF